LTFDWSAYHRLAQSLAKDTDRAETEAKQRSAISRGYYYVFHLARRHVEVDLGKARVRSDAHDQVWSTLETEGKTREIRAAGAKGKRLKVKRNQADYDASIAAIDRECQLALTEVDAIARLLGVSVP